MVGTFFPFIVNPSPFPAIPPPGTTNAIAIVMNATKSPQPQLTRLITGYLSYSESWIADRLADDSSTDDILNELLESLTSDPPYVHALRGYSDSAIRTELTLAISRNAIA